MNLQANLLQVAVGLFEEKGYARTSVQDIVSAAGVTKGAFYHYFTGKEDVLMALHEQYINGLLAKSTAVTDSTMHPTEKLSRLMEILLGEIAHYGAYAKVFFTEKHHLHPDHLQHIRVKRDAYAKLFEDVMREGMETGEFRGDLDPVIASLGILGICNWTYQWYRPDGKYTIDAITRFLRSIVETGILEKEARP
ncbi:TetR/AcrR family transcriptional regulator [Effusibacillus dendaii]|uniref:HTH tetR-type domain-containing protein n=1 Tax=Effusibacillus dendaii TaxID=2743772 RepID=A0A7I8D5L5_9BACL|nr:TetR/AcrR family transcriptional regulator [Effusibacillus dendaii]BCJ85443.1 hypothetical protein skT53_04280 [Effusibacillus dendaii]